MAVEQPTKDEQVQRFVRSYDGMEPCRYGEWIRLSDYERACAERDQYKQTMLEAQQLAVRQGNRIRELMALGGISG